MVSIADGNSLINAVQNNGNESNTCAEISCKKFQNNKKQDYIDNWNSRLFLHIDNDERPLTLADAFIMPHYEYHIKDKRMKLSETDTMNEVIEKFIMYDRSANMLITGAPGIGKTSIVSWMVNEYKENSDIIILKFRDWERDELDNGLFKAICNTLNCVKQDLENKTLILDGFDEIKVLDDGENLVRVFLNDILDYRNFKVIITSRTDYIDDHLFQYKFNLLPFSIEEIKQFYNIITGYELGKDLDFDNLDVLGIPVILYMAIMSDIDITKEATKPELYSNIFAEKGGIFDKFSYGGDGYDFGNQPLRDSENIKVYLKFLQDIAFKMFDEDNLSLQREEDKIPKLTFQGAKISVLEFPIRNLFENTISHIEFVHKSICEYFVSEYIIQQIKDVIYYDNFKEKLAAFFGKAFLHRRISYEIIDFLKNKISDRSLNYVYDRVVAIFQLMLEDGMLYHTNVCCKKVIECEMTVFANMLEIIHLWEIKSFNSVNLIGYYIKYNRMRVLNLSKMNLREADLTGAYLTGTNLREADLTGANLTGANLREAYLTGANLREANLREADLRGADLRGTNLTGANLRGTNLTGANLTGADLIETNLRGADLRGAGLREADLRGTDLREADFIEMCLRGTSFRGAIFDENQVQYLKEKYDLEGIQVFIIETNEIVTYEEYCRKIG